MQGLCVAEVMHPAVITICDEAPLTEALARMQEHGISALIVVDYGGQMVGLLSRSDLLRAWQDGVDIARGQGISVRQYMTREVISCAPHQPLAHALELMQQQIHRVVVVEPCEEGHFVAHCVTPVGVLSQTDIVRRLLGQSGELHDAPGTPSAAKRRSAA